MVRGQVGVQVPCRRVRCHGLDAQLPVDEHITRGQSCARRGSPSAGAWYRPCGSLLRLARVGRHGLRHVDVVSMAVVGVHSVRMGWWTLVCSSAGREQRG